MADFFPGDQIELPFFIEQVNPDGTKEVIDITEVSGILYETKTPTRIIKTYKHGTPDAPQQVDSKNVLFTITTADTLKCQPGYDYSFDVWVGSVKTTCYGSFGLCGSSPITKQVHG